MATTTPARGATANNGRVFTILGFALGAAVMSSSDDALRYVER